MKELEIKKEYLPDTVEKLTEFVLVGRQALVAVRARIKAIDTLGLAKEVREQKREEASYLAGALLDAETKIGELLKPYEEHRGRPNKKLVRTNFLPSGISKQQSYAFQQLAKNKDIVEKVKAEAKENDDLPTRTEVLRLIKEKDRNKRMEAERTIRVNSSSALDLRKGDFKKVLADVKNIDAIITDPPYPKEYLECFSELAVFAKERLKPSGFCVVYSGQYHLPEVIKRMSEHLTYVWTFCLYHVGKKQLVNGVNIMCGWKPVLVFSKGAKKMRFSAYDVLTSEKMEKHSHEWQQSESGIVQLVEIFSKPGDLVVDPFSGSATTLKVASDMGRKAIGAEIK